MESLFLVASSEEYFADENFAKDTLENRKVESYNNLWNYQDLSIDKDDKNEEILKDAQNNFINVEKVRVCERISNSVTEWESKLKFIFFKLITFI